MTLQVAAGESFVATLQGAPTGAITRLHVAVLDADGVQVGAPGLVSNVTVPPGDPAVYKGRLVAPDVRATGTVRWTLDDDPAAPGDQAQVFVEDLVVEPANYPQLDRVAALMRTRTRGGDDELGMNEQGVFDDTTNPTYAAAAQLRDQAVRDVELRIGVLTATPPPAAVPEQWTILLEAARDATVYRAAQLIELAVNTETVNDDQSAYKAYKDLWDEAIKALASAAADVRVGAAADPGDNQGIVPEAFAPDPLSAFDPDAITLASEW